MNKFLISMLFAVASLSLAYAKNVVPQFSDYPVKAVYTGKAAKLDLSDPSRQYVSYSTERSINTKTRFCR